jgi:hypothetical protein
MRVALSISPDREGLGNQCVKGNSGKKVPMKVAAT